ncbi:MAG: anti-sigma factor family protein [Natronincolaceae bacterium]|jgi:hypothetical protein|nr:zf-HC2 domain-containing protein [Bacillota bacterium]NLK90603.1 zf-HC2 domain-containing protein [Clostridiales bacterium]
MDCKNCETYSSAYIDNMLSEEEELKFKNHIRECKSCNIAFENLKIVVESTNMLEKVEPPADFSGELHKKLQDAKKCKSKSVLFNKGKMLSGIAATLLILVLSLSLVNNFLNCKKGVEFYSGTSDMEQGEESTNVDIASDNAEKRAMDGADDKEPIMALRMAPEDEISEDTSREMQGNTVKNGEVNSEEDTGLIGESDSNEKSAINESIQNLPDDKNLSRVPGLILALILIAGIAISVYKTIRR